jgi:hypothetical protein
VAESVPTDENGNFAVTIVAPKGAPINELASILVFKKDGPVLGGTSFTVIDKEPKGCPDAYFIGLHGTGEGPDGPNQVLSRAIGETWDHFYSLAQLDGKGDKVRGYAIDYPAPGWDIFPQINALIERCISGFTFIDVTVCSQKSFDDIHIRSACMLESQCLEPQRIFLKISARKDFTHARTLCDKR